MRIFLEAAAGDAGKRNRAVAVAQCYNPKNFGENSKREWNRMMASRSDEVSVLLADWTRGDQTAKDKLIPFVYDELRRLARRQLAQERPGHTLQATALVNEAYLLLVDQREVRWQNRAHFFALAAKVMRHILVDYARRRGRAKRGGGGHQVTLDEAL